MANQVYTNPNATIYDKIMEVAPQFKDLRAEKIVKINRFGERYVVDGLALESRSIIEYNRLRDELVAFIADSKSGQSYKKVALNEVGDRFLSVLSYIKMYENDERFDTPRSKIEQLRKDVMLAFFERLGYMALFFVPKENKKDFERIIRETEIESYRRQSQVN